MEKSRIKKIAQSVGAAIARMRTKAGLTQEEVAEALGIGMEAVSRLERGLVEPPVSRLVELADMFDCRLDELLMSASDRGTDQAAVIALQISQLAASDRAFLTNIVDQFSEHLRKPAEKRGKH